MDLREFFYFHKSDRILLLVILAFCICFAAIVWIVGNGEQQTEFASEDSLLFQKSPIPSKRQWHHSYRPYQQGTAAIRLTTFDPNTADSTQLLQLGLSPWQVRNIYKYRAKGGVYRKPEDFARLYGLTQKKYRELLPYIRISSDYQPASKLVGEREKPQPYERDTLKYPIKLQANEHIVLNTADTTTLKKVPGIGSAWAKRIVSYGQRLGGYVSVKQLLDMEDFPKESIDYFVVSNPHPHQINLNRLSLNDLRRHPYINFFQARAITDYRRLKGNLSSLDQLRLLKDFPPEAIERLKPYVCF